MRMTLKEKRVLLMDPVGFLFDKLVFGLSPQHVYPVNTKIRPTRIRVWVQGLGFVVQSSIGP